MPKLGNPNGGRNRKSRKSRRNQANKSRKVNKKNCSKKILKKKGGGSITNEKTGHFIEEITIPGDPTVYEAVFFNKDFKERWDQKYIAIVEKDKVIRTTPNKTNNTNNRRNLNSWRRNWDITKRLKYVGEPGVGGTVHTSPPCFVAILFKKEHGDYTPVAFCESKIVDEYVDINFVKVHPHFIGKHLCKPIVSYMIKNLKNLGFKELYIENESTTLEGIPACYCYYRAGIDNGYTMQIVNLKKDDSPGPPITYHPMSVEDCRRTPIPRHYSYKLI